MNTPSSPWPQATRRHLARLGRTGLALALGLCLLQGAAAQDWRQPGSNAGYSQFNPGESILSPDNVGQLQRVAQVKLGQFYAGPVTASGSTIFVCSNLLGLSALDAHRNEVLWSRSGLGNANCGAATLDDNTAYVTATASQSGTWVRTLTAIDRTTSATLWQINGSRDADLPKSSYLQAHNPTLYRGHLYVSYGRSLVEARDATTGALRWATRTGSLQNPAAVADGRVYLTTWGGEYEDRVNRVHALSAVDGRPLWRRKIDTTNLQYPPAVAGGKVFVAADSGALHALDAATGALLWRQTLPAWASGPLVATPNAVIAQHGNDTLSAFDADSGRPVWSKHLGPTEAISSNVVLAGQVLFFVVDGLDGQRLQVLEARTGEHLARFSDVIWGSRAQVAVAQGHVHITDSYGYLQTFSLP